jgi:hypothetical protein
MADVTKTAASIRLLPGSPNPFRKAAGGSGSVGDPVYIASDGDVEQADADASASSQAVGLVVSAPNGKTTFVAGDAVDVAGPGSRITGFSSLTPGALLYASVTAGAIANAAPAGSSGDYLWIIGRALDDTTILVLGFTTTFAAL